MENQMFLPEKRNSKNYKVNTFFASTVQVISFPKQKRYSVSLLTYLHEIYKSKADLNIGI